MPRYFIEVAYDGTRYSGFQIQKNADTIQAEVTDTLNVFYKSRFELTCSSRTDAGVHAFQNYFHFDSDTEILNPDLNVYNLNAILPADIVIKRMFRVKSSAHCRFDAVSRVYHYHIYHKKNPFIRQKAFFFPFRLDVAEMNKAASILMDYSDFTSFSKKKTQVKNFKCDIIKSEWVTQEEQLVYIVESNRFLRGMVKALVGTMLRVGRGKIGLSDFRRIIEEKNAALADFSAHSRGLFLMQVKFKTLKN